MAVNYPPVPGPVEDPYQGLQDSLPAAGPVLATVLRGLDAYTKAVPRRILGGLLSVPGIGDALSIGSDRGRIMRAFNEQGATAAAETWAGDNTLKQIAGDTLFDPILGMGPVAKIGDVALGGLGRSLIGVRGSKVLASEIPDMAGLRKAEVLKNLAGDLQSGKRIRNKTWSQQFEEKAAGLQGGPPQLFEFPVMEARPGSDAFGRGRDFIESKLRPLGGGYAPRTINSQLLAEERDALAEMSRRFGVPLPDAIETLLGSKDLKNFNEGQKIQQVLIGQGMPDRLAKIIADERENIWKAYDQGYKRDKFSAFERVREVVEALSQADGTPVQLPRLSSKQNVAQKRDTFNLIQKAAIDKGILSSSDLLRAAERAYGPNSPKLDPLRAQLAKFEGRLDPLNPETDMDLLLHNVLDRRLRILNQNQKGPASGLLGGIGKMSAATLGIEREQSLATAQYLAGNKLTRLFQMTANGISTPDALRVELESMQSAWKATRGGFKGLPPREQRLALTPPKARTFAGRLGVEIPSTLDPPISAMLDLEPTVDELIHASKTNIERMGIAYPALTGVLGAIATGNPVGGLVGALGGKLTQKMAPTIRQAEAIADYAARSIMWQRETGRVVNEAMMVGLGDAKPFYEKVFDAVSSVEGTGAKNAFQAKYARNVTPEDRARELVDTLMKSNGFIGSDELGLLLRSRAPGLNDATLNGLVREWRNILDDASQAGVKASERVMAIPKSTNLDEKLRHVLLFHHFTTRFIPAFAENVMGNPSVLALVMRQWAAAEKEGLMKGLPDRLSGTVGVIFPETAMLGGLVEAFYGKGSLRFDPTQSVNPFGNMGRQDFQPEGEDSDPIRQSLEFAGSIGFQPRYALRFLASIYGLYGSEAPSPDFFRIGPLLRNLPVGADINKPVRQLSDTVRKAMGQDPGEYQDYAVRKKVRELAQDMGMDPNSPRVRAIEANPQHPLYQEAALQVQRTTLAQQLQSTFLPLPGGVKFYGDREAQVRAQNAEVLRNEGLRDDMGGMFSGMLDQRYPQLSTYRGLSMQQPNLPSVQQMLQGQDRPRQFDPQRVVQDYVAWAQSRGIDPQHIWDRRTLQDYFAQRNRNVELSRRMTER